MCVGGKDEEVVNRKRVESPLYIMLANQSR
jgi:hypothetical protein